MTEFLSALAQALPPGALVTDLDALTAYRTDAADHVPAGQPAAAVLATSTADVQTALRWASEHGVPVVPRGAGTGLSGGSAATDGALVVSLARMRRIVAIRPADQIAEVEPGVVNADLGRAAAEHGLTYPVDPSSFEISTLGGNIATNAGGLRCVKYGVTRESVLGLEVVLADGRVIRTGGATVKNVAGYDLTRLFVGSEGTLGIVTAATLRLRPRPPGDPVTFVASFPSLVAVGDAVAAIFATGVTPSLLELMDRASVNLVEDYRRMDLDRDAAALLLGQSDSESADADVTAMAAACEKAGAGLVVRSSDAAEADLLLSARRLQYYATHAAGEVVTDDVGVPRSRLADLLAGIETVAAESGLLIATAGHAGDGNLHPSFVLPRGEPDQLARALDAAERICGLAVDLGGTITGEHGVGLLKRRWLGRQFDSDTWSVHRAIKAALDPQDILNPGKAI